MLLRNEEIGVQSKENTFASIREEDAFRMPNILQWLCEREGPRFLRFLTWTDVKLLWRADPSLHDSMRSCFEDVYPETDLEFEWQFFADGYNNEKTPNFTICYEATIYSFVICPITTEPAHVEQVMESVSLSPLGRFLKSRRLGIDCRGFSPSAFRALTKAKKFSASTFQTLPYFGSVASLDHFNNYSEVMTDEMQELLRDFINMTTVSHCAVHINEACGDMSTLLDGLRYNIYLTVKGIKSEAVRAFLETNMHGFALQTVCCFQ